MFKDLRIMEGWSGLVVIGRLLLFAVFASGINATCPAPYSDSAPYTFDQDSDGVLYCHDKCPFDPRKTEAGACGCFSPDNDGDSDGMMDCYERDFSSQSEDFQCGMDMQLNECWVTNVHFQWNEVGGWEAQELFGDRWRYEWREDGHYMPIIQHEWHSNVCAPQCFPCVDLMQKESCEARQPLDQGACKWCIIEGRCHHQAYACQSCNLFVSPGDCSPPCTWCASSGTCVLSTEGNTPDFCDCYALTGDENICQNTTLAGNCVQCESGVCSDTASSDIVCTAGRRPMANDDSVFVAQGDGVSIFVLDNDEIVGEAGNESLVLAGLEYSNGNFSFDVGSMVEIYTEDLQYVNFVSSGSLGTFLCGYRVGLNNSNSPVAFGNISITVGNLPPQTVADTFTINVHDHPNATEVGVVLDVLANDFDAGRDPIFVDQIVSCPSDARCEIINDGQQISLIPNSSLANATSWDIVYTAIDHHGERSNNTNVNVAVVDPPRFWLVSASPRDGEDGVALTRETILSFSLPLHNNISRLSQAFRAVIGENDLAFRTHLSFDRYTVTLFYNEPLPSSSTIRIDADGSKILSDSLIPFTNFQMSFSTLATSPLPNTAVCGRVFASEFEEGTESTAVNRPLGGVIITVDTRNDLIAVTDSSGNFVLDPCPANRFFVHIDGRHLSHPNHTGSYYPFVGKAWVSVPQQLTSVGDVYLPMVVQGTLQTVSNHEATDIFFPAVFRQDLRYQNVKITVPAGALMADNGTKGGMVGIAPVDPTRLPGTLPSVFTPSLVITVQTNGPGNFDVPAPVCFPNLPSPVDGSVLKPGDKSALWSFNHDTGGFEISGTATVSSLGDTVCTDPGVGVRAPGWHFVLPAVSSFFGKVLGCDFNQKRSSDRSFFELMGSSSGNTLENRALSTCSCETIRFIGRTVVDVATCALNFTPLAGLQECVSELSQLSKTFNDNVELEYSDPTSFPEECAITRTAHLGLSTAAAAGGCLTATFSPMSRACGITKCAIDSGIDLISNGCEALRSCSLTSSECKFYSLKNFQNTLKLTRSVACNDFPNKAFSSANGIAALSYISNSFENGENPCSSPEYLQRRESVRRDGQRLAEALSAFGIVSNAAQEFQDEITQNMRITNTDAALSIAQSRATPYYYSVSTSPNSKVKGRASLAGEVGGVALPPETPISIHVYDPESDRIGMSVGVTPVAGRLFRTSPIILVEQDGLADTDSDGLSDPGEEAVGTDPFSPDTDQDGVNDHAELQSSSNPLDGVQAAPGITAAISTSGVAVDLCIGNELATVATSDRGVAIFNVFFGESPAIVAQIPVGGTSTAVGCGNGWVISNRGDGSAVVIDTRIPANSLVIGTVDMECDIVISFAVQGELAVVGCQDGTVSIVDLPSRTVVFQHNWIFAPIFQLGLSSSLSHVFIATTNTLWKTPLLRASTIVHGDSEALVVTGAGASSRINVGTEFIAMSWHNGDARIVGIDPFVEYGSTDGTYGSDPGVSDVIQVDSSTIVVARINDGALDVWDSTDPQNLVYQRTVMADGLKDCRVAVFNGLLFTACTSKEVFAVRFMPPDFAQQPPSVFVEAPDEAEEGSMIAVSLQTEDDVIVRQVQFQLNGVTFEVDSSFPFAVAFPVRSTLVQPSSEITVTVRVFDTAGNRAVSSKTIAVLPPTSVPVLLATIPAHNDYSFDGSGVLLLFSSPVDPSSVSPGSFSLVNLGPDGMENTADDEPEMENMDVREVGVSAISLQLSNSGLLTTSKYRLFVNLTQWYSYAGTNGNGSMEVVFTNYCDMPKSSLVWTSDTDGSWTTATNWNRVRVPTNNDNVVIAQFGANPRVTVQSYSRYYRRILVKNSLYLLLSTARIMERSDIASLDLNAGQIVADGANVTAHIGGSYNSLVHAMNGGKIQFSAEGDELSNRVTLLATTGGIVESETLRSVESFPDFCVFKGESSGTISLPAFGPNLWCNVEVLSGAKLFLDHVETISCGMDGNAAYMVVKDPESTISLPRAQNITCQKNIEIVSEFGAALSFPQLEHINAAVDIVARFSSGSPEFVPSILSMPNLLEVVHTIHTAPSSLPSEDLDWIADCHGCRLDLSRLERLPSHCRFGQYAVIVSAANGGLVEVSSATQPLYGCRLSLTALGGGVVNASSFHNLTAQDNEGPSLLLQENDASLVLGDIDVVQGHWQITNRNALRNMTLPLPSQGHGKLEITVTNAARITFSEIGQFSSDSSFQMVADGTGSVIDLRALLNLTASLDEESSIEQRHGGLVRLNPQLHTVRGRLTLRSATDGEGWQFVTLSSLEGGVHLVAVGGGFIDLPLVTHVNSTVRECLMQSEGSGSRLSLPLLEYLECSVKLYDGSLDLSAVRLMESRVFDIDLDVRMDGFNISHLQTVKCLSASNRLLITTSNNAILNFTSLTELHGNVDITASEGSTVSMPVLVEYLMLETAERDTVVMAQHSQSSIRFPALEYIPSHSDSTYRFKALALNEGSIIFDVALSLVDDRFGRFTLRADGYNARLSAPLLSSLRASTQWSYLQQVNGGNLDLPGLQHLEGTIDVYNVNSDVQVFPLLTYLDGGFVVYAHNSGGILLPALQMVRSHPDGCSITGNAAAVGLPALSSPLSCNIFALNGGSVDLGQCPMFQSNHIETRLEVVNAGSRIQMDSLTTLLGHNDSSSVLVIARSGASFTLPESLQNVTGVVHLTADSAFLNASSVIYQYVGWANVDVVWKAANSGNLILDGLLTVRGNLNPAFALFFYAVHIGVSPYIRCSVTEIVEGHVEVLAQYGGGHVDLPSLTAVRGSSVALFHIADSSAARISLPLFSTVEEEAQVTLRKNGALGSSRGIFALASHLLIQGQLTFTHAFDLDGLNILNNGTMQIGGADQGYVLTVSNYTQEATALMSLYRTNFLRCTGRAILDGSLSVISVPNGLQNDVFMEYSSVTGTFNSTFPPSLSVDYGATQASMST